MSPCDFANTGTTTPRIKRLCRLCTWLFLGIPRLQQAVVWTSRCAHALRYIICCRFALYTLTAAVMLDPLLLLMLWVLP